MESQGSKEPDDDDDDDKTHQLCYSPEREDAKATNAAMRTALRTMRLQYVSSQELIAAPENGVIPRSRPTPRLQSLSETKDRAVRELSSGTPVTYAPNPEQRSDPPRNKTGLSREETHKARFVRTERSCRRRTKVRTVPPFSPNSTHAGGGDRHRPDPRPSARSCHGNENR